MGGIALVARLLLAVLFGIAGVAKVRDLPGTRRALAGFGVPAQAVGPGAVLLPLAELAAAAALVVRPSARWGAIATLCLLVVFTAAIVRVMARGETPDCGCFGQLGSGPTDRRALVRNGLLAVPAGCVVAYGAGEGLGEWVSGHSVAELVAILAVLCAAALTVLAARLWRENRRLNRDVEIRRYVDAVSPPGLPVGAPAPDFSLPSTDGTTISLTGLLERGRPVALVFVTPGSYPLIADLARWQTALAERVTIALVSGGSKRENRDMAERYGLELVLLENGRDVSKSFRARATPSVVLVGPDARIASRTYYTGMMIEAVIRRALQIDYAPPGLRVITVNGHEMAEPPREMVAAGGQFEPA